MAHDAEVDAVEDPVDLKGDAALWPQSNAQHFCNVRSRFNPVKGE